MAKNGKISLRDDEVPVSCLDSKCEVDFSDQIREKNGIRKDVRSECITYGKETLWKARNSNGEIYWTNSSRSPQILNVATNRPRGNLAFINGDVGKLGGRKPGSKNRITAREICADHDAHPAEYFLAIMTKDPQLCRKYRIKDVNKITIKEQSSSADKLYERLEGKARSTTLDASGEPIVEGQGEEGRNDQFQVYLTAPTNFIRDDSEEVDE